MATARMNDFVLREALLKPAPIGFPQGRSRVSVITSKTIVMDDLALGLAGAMGRRARKSG
jgi:hypothetical protein